jgi:catechol 2,3-dioxygenase-like lactoylglutathione lyase family enzyme
MKLEVVLVPVSDVDRAKEFYESLGRRMDIEGLQLTVTDIGAARADLVGRGIEVSEVFHGAGGIFHHIGSANRAPGPAPEKADYGSFASFEDPDGNGWLLQEINTRAPGR